MPLVYRGNPPRAVSDTQLLQRLRWAEDKVEQETGILLAPTYVSAPAIPNQQDCNSAGIYPTSGGAMVQGVDYDIGDDPVDFRYSLAKDDGWLVMAMRFRPLRIFDGGTTAVKTCAYSYPLLNQYYVIDPSWFVENRDSGYLRVVPSKDTQMLPLFALQLAVTGFAEDLPGGWQVLYTAGLSPADYAGRFAFMKELVLATAGVSILSTIQGTVNLGMAETNLQADGVAYSQKWSAKGAYGDIIAQFIVTRDNLAEQAAWTIAGPQVFTL